MKRYYFCSIFTCLIIVCISFFAPAFVNGQATSGRVEISGADTQLAVGLEASTPSGWQLHPIILAASRGDAAQNYLLNSQLILNFFNEVGQSNAVVADVIVQHADLTRRYGFGVHPVSELSAPVPQMQIIVSRADGVKHSMFSRPSILGDAPPTPTVTHTATPIPTNTATYSPTPTATDTAVPNTATPTPTETITYSPTPTATDTAVPNTATPTPTETTTYSPTPTATDIPATDTAIPSTATPIPTETTAPEPTATQVPATEIPTSIPATITAAPPTDTPMAIPTLTTIFTPVPDTVTPIPVTNTPMSTSVPSDTPTSTQMPATITPAPSTATPIPVRGDAYETDDLCSQAKPLPIDSGLQERTFHQQGDEDWAQVELEIGNTYEFSAFNTSPKSDLSLDISANCEGPSSDNAMTALGAGAEIVFVATTNMAYIRVMSQNADVYGTDVTYTLEAKDLTEDSGDLAIIIVGRDDRDRGQRNIFKAANRAYRTFRNAGILPDQIRYLGLIDGELGDVDGDGTSEIDTAATIENIEEVITNWPRGQVNEGGRVYIYMVDHGLENQMLVDGQANVLTPDMLNQWLNVLELYTKADVAVIYEACLSGSFIVKEQSISKSGRLVITSTQPNTNAYTRPGGGTIFSDQFFSALDQGKTFYEAYEEGMEAAMLVHPRQIPMLDDNGDYSNDGDDGTLAKVWMLNDDALSGDGTTLPVLAELQLTETATDGEVTIRAAISGNEKAERIWVEVYPPSYIEPETTVDGIMPELNLPVVELFDTNNDGSYIGTYEGFVDEGSYRFVAYAEDVDGNMLLPSARTMEKLLDPEQLDGTSESLAKRIYLPLISR